MKNITKLLLVILLFCHYATAHAQNVQTVPNANSFSSYLPYTGDFNYGVNPGYYGEKWTSQNEADLASGNKSKNFQGVGVKTLRIPLYDEYLTRKGQTSLLNDFQYFAGLGISDITAFVGSPAPAHRMDSTFAGSPETTKVFKNLYDPIWLDNNATIINPNNYFAKYLYDVVKTYGSYVKFWEIINEPDFTYSPGGWGGDATPPDSKSWFYLNPTPEQLINLRAPIFYYIRELRVAREVIKKLSPNSYICTGGIGYKSFLDALLRNTDNPDGGLVTNEFPFKAGAYFDVLSFHFYPEFSLKIWDPTIGALRHFRHSDAGTDVFITAKNNLDNLLIKYGYDNIQYPKKQFICTETGVSRIVSGADDWGSNEAQKNYIIKCQIAAQKNGIKQTYWYQLGDFTNPTQQFDQMGLYYYFGNYDSLSQVKVADQGKALKTTSDLLVGKIYDDMQTTALNLPSSVDGAAFRAKDGSFIYVLWAKTSIDQSEVASAPYSFPNTIASATALRKEWDFAQTGKITTVASQNITLTGTPSFFESAQQSTADQKNYTLLPATIRGENYAAMSGVQNEPCLDEGGGQDVGYIDPSDWMEYNINVPTTGSYLVSFRVACPADKGQFQLRKQDGSVLATIQVPNTGDYQKWQTLSVSLKLVQGLQTLRIVSTSPLWNSWNLNWIKFAIQPADLHIKASEYSSMLGVQLESTSDEGGGQNVGYIDMGDWMEYNVTVPVKGIYTLSLRVASPVDGAKINVLNNGASILTTIGVPNTGGFQLWQTVSVNISLQQGAQLIRFSSLTPSNWNINWWELANVSTPPYSFKIEAEDYIAMYGVGTEPTTDVGGGLNVDYIDPWHWMDYSINIKKAGNYKIEFRIASPNNSAQFELRNAAASTLATLHVPNTGGFQNWQTISTTLNLSAGQQTLRIISTAPPYNSWNINWLQFTLISENYLPSAQLATNKDIGKIVDENNPLLSAAPLQVHPNPAMDRFTLHLNTNLTGTLTIELVNFNGVVQKRLFFVKSDKQNWEREIFIQDLPVGTYILKAQIGNWMETKKILKEK
ncbi:MAG: hypothetical protein NVSMB67_18150 [Flavisolibacter sp.]